MWWRTVHPDRPEEADVLVESRAEAREIPSCRVSAETRDRLTYEAELRAAVAADRWQSVVTRFNERWAEHEAKWRLGADSRPEASETRRQIDSDVSREVDRGCDRIRDIEQRVITPAMQEIAAQDPSRELVGLDHRLKGPDRLKEKVADYLIADSEASPSEALSRVPDGIRFTFCYSDDRYASGVLTDIDRLESRGFNLVKPLKNVWDSDLYKGINSQWRDPESGQRFEVQFHTWRSYEAKQVTHVAYERLRSSATSGAERELLKDLQREVCAAIPIPAHAGRIRHGSWEEQHG
jgi:hypothetical protein